MQLKNGIKIKKLKKTRDKLIIDIFLAQNRLMNPVALAKDFHNFYENNAKELGWETQKDCKAKEFHELPKRNIDTMVYTAANILTKYWVIPKDKVI